MKVHPYRIKTEGGIYLPQGNLEERTGTATATVVSVGKGKLNVGKDLKKGKYSHSGLETGNRIVFRGFLQEANRPGGIIDKDHCLVHMDDVIGLVED